MLVSSTVMDRLPQNLLNENTTWWRSVAPTSKLIRTLVTVRPPGAPRCPGQGLAHLGTPWLGVDE